MFRESQELSVERGALDITLKFNGSVPASQDGKNGDKRSGFKQELRLQFSQQLRRLWKRDLLASFYADGLPVAPYERHKAARPPQPTQHPFFRVNVCGFSVISLVNWHNGLNCELEFVFLGDQRGAIDLDNQMKVVFDALRIPQHDAEVPADKHGQDDEELFCLLEDDSIVKKYSVESRFGGGGSPPDDELLILARVVYSGGTCHPALALWR